MKFCLFVLFSLMATSVIGKEKIVADFGNHLISRATKCGKRADSILQQHQRRLIATASFGLPELPLDGGLYTDLIKHSQSSSLPLPPGVIQIILHAPRLDGVFRDVYVMCRSGEIIFTDRGIFFGQVRWYGPIKLSDAIGTVVTHQHQR